MTNAPDIPAPILEQSLFEKLLHAAPDPILIVGRDGRIVMANVQASRTFGYDLGELIGSPMEILVPTRFRGQHARQREGYAKAPRTRPMGVGLDLTARHKDGHEIPVEISLSPLDTESGSYVISIVRDITERKTFERRLEARNAALLRSNEELEQFAYVASHDLQEPLRGIAGACQLLMRRYGDRFDGDARELFAFAVDGSKRLQTLINDLLQYSRVTSKVRPMAPVELEQVLAQALGNLAVSLEETGAKVTHGPLPRVVGDPVQLTQVFQNLVGNALKFRDQKAPLVHVAAERQGDAWRISVRDNGIGIDPKYFDRLFVIFKRLHTRDHYQGNGVGLAICKKVVERHGGRIWVESEPGAGATFVFTLPVSQDV